MRTVAVAGSTGSIGRQAVEVLEAERERFRCRALVAWRSWETLADQARRLAPDVVGLVDPAGAKPLAERLLPGTELVAGSDALSVAAELADVVLDAVVGFAGLPVALDALERGRRLALANKESLISAGPVVRRAQQRGGGEIVPVDSEHAALHQCLRAAGSAKEVAALVLTASGGPFRGRSAEELASVTVEDALAHPTWRMGPKITVDSSTLMNKGLEVIEARELFDVEVDRIRVVVHPESVVHSMVELVDGAIIAQLSSPDMRLPIGYALGYPDRIGTPFGALDLAVARTLHFEPPDEQLFPCLGLAFEAARLGSSAPTWLSAANEVAVAAFLDGRLAWREIAEVVEESMSAWDGMALRSVEDVYAADSAARAAAGRAVGRREAQ